MKRFKNLAVVAAVVATMAASAEAVELLAPGNSIISINTGPPISFSDSPGNEPAYNAADLFPESKYLNFGKIETGFIVSPLNPGTVLRSLVFATANDAVERDPTSFKVYGTNDAITSVDHGTGSQESWTLIAEGDLTLPDERLTEIAPISFENSTPYDNYRVLFPTVKDPAAANSMQIAEARGYESATPDTSQYGIWEDLDPFVPFQLPQPAGQFPVGQGPTNLLDFGTSTLASASNSPGNEGPEHVVDGVVAKYLNFGAENSGFIVTPSVGATTVQSFKFYTANDHAERDPASYALYGTNDPITSANHSLGDQENWTLITEGPLSLPDDRNALTDVTAFSNSTSYSSYRMIFPTVKDAAAANSMQIGEAFFFEDMIGAGEDDLLMPGDPVLAIDTDVVATGGVDTKFVNLGGANGGFIVSPSASSSIVDEFQIETANDFPGRDPATWEIYGTNDPITSAEGGEGDEENWVLIDSGVFTDAQVPTDRFATGEAVPVDNATEYSSYRVLFPQVRDPDEAGADGLLQLAGFQLFGEAISAGVDFDGDGDVDGADFLAIQRADPSLISAWEAAFGDAGAAAAGAAVPEPTAAMLLLCGILATSALGRGRASRSC